MSIVESRLWADRRKTRWAAWRRRLLVVAALLTSTTSQFVGAATHVLENDRLRLEVDDAAPGGFSYSLIDKSTAATLVHQDLMRFTFGAQGQHTANTGALTSGTSNSLSFDLTFDGIASPGTATYTLEGNQLSVNIAHSSATQVRQRFDDQGENIYGLFEYDFTPTGGGMTLNNRGVDRQTLGMQGGNGTDDASARAPFYVTNQGYGVYAETTALGRYQMATNVAGTGERSTFEFDDSQLTYHVIAGTPKEVMQGYNDIAGGSFLPPDWALGTIWWRDDAHQNLAGQLSAQARVLADAAELRTRQIPATALWVDRPWTDSFQGWGDLDAQNRFVWDSSSGGFPDPARMVETLRETYGMELMVWIANRTNINTFSNEFANQAPNTATQFSGGSLASFDMRDRDSYDWVRDTLSTIASQYGVAGYKIDRGDQSEMPNSVVNENLTLFGKASVESLTQGGIEEPFVFARAVYDTGRKYTALWNGDTTRDFTGLQVSLVNMLRSGAINMPVYGSDTGGYNNGFAPPKLFARWLGFSAYSPIMEVILGNSGGDWNSFSAADLESIAIQTQTHHELIPYVRSYLDQATQTGLAVARPMVFEFPDDPNVTDLADQYMYGDALLVAPVVTSSDKRDVYLPAGEWIDYNDKVSRYEGEQTISLSSVPLNTVPVFVKRGEIVVRGDIVQGNNDWTPDWAPSLDIEVFLPDGDASNQFAYYTGADAEPVTPIAYEKNGDALVVAFGDLGADGTVSLYLDDATSQSLSAGSTFVMLNGEVLSEPDFLYAPDQQRVDVAYAGPTTLALSDVPGDYNGDGTVGAADYVVWRRYGGSPVAYDTWRGHFGQTAGGGARSNSVVAEPVTSVLMIVAAVLASLRRFRVQGVALVLNTG
jgi:alpha-D-xyloside xylohydrolase